MGSKSCCDAPRKRGAAHKGASKPQMVSNRDRRQTQCQAIGEAGVLGIEQNPVPEPDSTITQMPSSPSAVSIAARASRPRPPSTPSACRTGEARGITSVLDLLTQIENSSKIAAVEAVEKVGIAQRFRKRRSRHLFQGLILVPCCT